MKQKLFTSINEFKKSEMIKEKLSDDITNIIKNKGFIISSNENNEIEFENIHGSTFGITIEDKNIIDFWGVSVNNGDVFDILENENFYTIKKFLKILPFYLNW